MQILPIKMILICMLALLASIDKQQTSYFILKSKHLQVALRSLSALFCITLAVWVLYETKILITAFTNWQTALTQYHRGNYNLSIAGFKKAYPILNNDGDFLMNYGKALAMNGNNKESKTILQHARLFLNTSVIETTLGDIHKELKEYNEAELAYTKAANMVPNRLYPEYLLVKLYQESGRENKAYEKAKKIAEKGIKIPSRATEEILKEMNIIINGTEQPLRQSKETINN
jgi:tetratricopeptide (TPR) repeat protein